jgi:amino acid transporter
VSNVGYVFATCTALSAFVLLRRDRPNWPRPVRLPNWYVPLGAALAGFNFILLIFGGFIYSGGFLGITGYGYGWDKTRAGLIVLLAAFVLYLWRHRRAGQDPDPPARGGPADAGGGDAPPGVPGRARRRAVGLS